MSSVVNGADFDADAGRVVILGCTRRKARRSAGAIELYEGGFVPQFRAAVASRWWDRVWFLSARHGLVGATTELDWYDEPLTPQRVAVLAQGVEDMACSIFDAAREGGAGVEVLVGMDDDYFALIAAAVASAGVRMRRVSHDGAGWPDAVAVLDSWGWLQRPARTVAAALATTTNDHRPIVAAWVARHEQRWGDETPASAVGAGKVSVVVPAYNVAYCLDAVLDALERQHYQGEWEVIVVDDCSTHATSAVAGTHPVVTRAVRLGARSGAGQARNVGVAVATGDVVLFVDADMVLPCNVVRDVAVRASPDLVLVGFRHNIGYDAFTDAHVSGEGLGQPDVGRDHRVVWSAPSGVPMFYSGQVYDQAFTAHPLEDSREFVNLGFGRPYFDWSLQRMVVTALVAVCRERFAFVGGFDPRFDEQGWGSEDTHLGAVLIAAGCFIVPVRCVVGHHIDPPEATDAWQAKFATAPARIALYRHLLNQAPPTNRHSDLARRCEQLLAQAETIR